MLLRVGQSHLVVVGQSDLGSAATNRQKPLDHGGECHGSKLMWVKTMPCLPPPHRITMFIGGIQTIPSHGWFMILHNPHVTLPCFCF